MRVPFLDTEADRVEGWRLRELIAAGYPVVVAERIARDLTVDLHKAVELLRRGCPPELAARILL